MSAKALILVQLLEKIPDADKLRRLLEPENLLYLLQQYGYHKEELQHRLKNGTLPGELLLELLEREADVGYLLGMLSDTMDTKVEKRVVLDEIINQKKAVTHTTPLVTPAVPTSVIQTDTQKTKNDSASSSQINKPLASVPTSDEGFFSNNYLLIVLVIMSATSVAPALMQADFFAKVSITREVATLVAFIGGALAGAVVSYGVSSALWKSILIGVVFNLGVLWATIIYTQARTTIFKIEILIPLFLGGLPAVGLYYLLNQKK